MTDDTPTTADAHTDDERDIEAGRVCPECGNPVPKRIRGGIFFCRNCMKAVRPLDVDDADTVVPVYRPDEEPIDEPFSDGDTGEGE